MKPRQRLNLFVLRKLFFVPLILSLTMCQGTEECSDSCKLEAKKEGIKIGYDSALRKLESDRIAYKANLMNFIRKSDSIGLISTKKFDHPPKDGHIHNLEDKEQVGGAEVGQMILTLREDHRPEYYLDYVNTMNIPILASDGISRTHYTPSNHGHFNKRIIWVNQYDSNGNILFEVPIAIDLEKYK